MSPILIYSENTDLAAQLIGLVDSLDGAAVPISSSAQQAAVLSALPVHKVCALSGASSRPEDYAQAIADLVRAEDPSVLLVGDTVTGREIAARVAAVLDIGLVSGATELVQTDSGLAVTRMFYGGSVLKTYAVDELAVITVPGGKATSPAPTGAKAPVLTTSVDALPSLELVATAPIVREGADLATAEVVVCAGGGFDSKDQLQLAQDLAAVLGGAVGCTRPMAEDRKWLPLEAYIGISGVAIQARLYLCAGVSGQVQHTVGIRDAKLVVAINKDEKAPIFRVADYGIVGDLAEILPLLTRAAAGQKNV